MDDPLISGSIFSDELGGTDSELWLKLFIEADKIGPDFAARLMYMRNSGCRLVPNKKFNYVIQPIKALWESEEFYKQEKTCLMDFRDELTGLLGGLK